MKNQIPSGFVLMTLSAIAFTCSNVGIKVLGEAISPWQVCVGRGLVGMVLALVIMKFNFRAIFGHHCLWPVLLGMTNTLGFICLVFAIKMLPLTIYVPLCFVYPALAALLSPLINKENPSRTEWMAMAVAFIAIIFLSQGATAKGESNNWTGMLMGLMGALWMAVMSNLARRQSQASIGINIFHLFFANFIIALPVMIIFDSPALPSNLDMARLFLFIVPATLIAFSLMFAAYRHLSAHLGGVILTLVEMVLAILYGLIFLGEPLTIYMVVGSTMMLVSGLMIIARS